MLGKTREEGAKKWLREKVPKLPSTTPTQTKAPKNHPTHPPRPRPTHHPPLLKRAKAENSRNKWAENEAKKKYTNTLLSEKKKSAKARSRTRSEKEAGQNVARGP